MKKLFFILLLASSFASAQKVNGYISFMYSLGVPSDTIALPPSEKSNPHFAVKGNDSYIWSVPQQKWIILIAGGNTYTNGNGLLLSGNVFKVDTFSIATRVRVLKEIDSVKNLMVYTNGFGIAPIVSNVIRADTFNIATRPYVKKVADSIKANIGIPTLQQVLDAGANMSHNNTVIQTNQSFSLNGGLIHMQSLSFAGQGFLDIGPNATTISSVLVGGTSTLSASVATKSDEVYPYVQIQSGVNGTGYGSVLRFTRDSIFFAPFQGVMGIDSLAEYTDSITNLPMTWNTTTHRWGHLNRWPGAVGGGGGGGGPDVFLGNVLKSGFDTLLYFPSWNNAVILTKGVQLTAGSSKLSLVKTVTDSTLAWEADVVPGNISLSALGGSLNISQINATGTASSSTYLRGDGTWSAAAGGGSLSGMTAGRIQTASSSSALADYANLTWDNTNKRIVLTSSDGEWASKAGIEMVNSTGDKRAYIYTYNYDFRITSNFFGTNGVISMNGQGDDVKFSNAYPGAMIFAPNTVEQFRLDVSGKAFYQTLKTGSTAPTTSGTTKMVITDANGMLSFADIPSGGGSGETNTASNLGGGLANFSAKSGVDLQFNSFTASDFNLASNLISIDYTNGQAASASNKGFLTSTDWSTFNGKAAATGGSGYVQNQFSSAQTAQFWVNGQSRIDNELLINTVDIGAYNLQLNGGFYNKVNAGDNWVVEASGTTSLFATYQSTGSGGTGFFLKSGDASTGSKFSYVDFWNYDATEQRWDIGTYGTNNFTFRDRTNSKDALVITANTGNIKTLYTGSGSAIAQFDASGNFSRGVDPATLQAVTYDVFSKATVTTTTATATSIADVTIPDNTAGTIEVNWIAIKSDGTQAYGSVKNFSFRKTSGTLTIDASGQSLYSNLNEITASSQFATSGISLNSNNLRIFVQGVPSTTVKWKAVYKINYVN